MAHLRKLYNENGDCCSNCTSSYRDGDVAVVLTWEETKIFNHILEMYEEHVLNSWWYSDNNPNIVEDCRKFLEDMA